MSERFYNSPTPPPSIAELREEALYLLDCYGINNMRPAISGLQQPERVIANRIHESADGSGLTVFLSHNLVSNCVQLEGYTTRLDPLDSRETTREWRLRLDFEPDLETLTEDQQQFVADIKKGTANQLREMWVNQMAKRQPFWL